MIAVALGRFHGHEHFYTNSGKWFATTGVKTLFVVNNFAGPAELEPIIAELPLEAIAPEEISALKDLGHDPSRTAGAPLMKRMYEFTQEAEAVYQDNAAVLDASSSFIVDPTQSRCLTLHEITDLLLPMGIKKQGRFSTAALYAVHRALMQDEVFFRPLRQTGPQKSYLYEISSLTEVRIVQKVEYLVRDHLRRPVHQREKEKGVLWKFVRTARSVIDQNRQNRAPSPHGMIGPSSSPSPAPPKWSPEDLEILHFIELWASYQRFPNYSNLQCTGSSLLRLINRYEGMTLDGSAGWTFLQEVGWIPPWEVHARYSVRFPGVGIKRGGGFVRPHGDEDLSRHLQPDQFAGQRKEWDLTAYAIDAESTMDVDDAVSVEWTPNRKESWIHVHVADPASSIAPNTPIASFVELIPQTVYLQGHFSRMLPNSIGTDKFSLGKGKPTLTFSALVDTKGRILDQKITPGILNDVVYMTPEAVNETVNDTPEGPAVPDGELVVGSAEKYKPPRTREFTRPQDLSLKQRKELASLLRLAKALDKVRLARGATPFFASRAEPSVSFGGVTQEETPDGFITAVGDPTIRVGHTARTSSHIVESTMRLAGEVAARWCHDRGIPIPYRTQPHAAPNIDLIRDFNQKVLTPMFKSGARPDPQHWRHLRALLGSDLLSTSPGPHPMMGIDMYTKATSPLRRFSDLLVHWQVEAALLEETKRGTSLVGNTHDDFLPFSREQLDRMLPMLQVRERQVRLLSNGTGAEQWILQALVRAWRFGEAELPSTFRFTVDHIVGRKSLGGRLDFLDLPANMRFEHLHEVCLMANVRVNDVFEVKLRDVNIHATSILVEAVRLIQRGEHSSTMFDLSAPTQRAIADNAAA